MKERALREIPENKEQTLAALILQGRRPSAYPRIPTPTQDVKLLALLPLTLRVC